jgi:hypothetical protein
VPSNIAEEDRYDDAMVRVLDSQVQLAGSLLSSSSRRIPRGSIFSTQYRKMMYSCRSGQRRQSRTRVQVYPHTNAEAILFPQNSWLRLCALSCKLLQCSGRHQRPCLREPSSTHRTPYLMKSLQRRSTRALSMKNPVCLILCSMRTIET